MRLKTERPGWPWAWVGLGLALAAPAHAATECELLEESEFIALVLNGQVAVDRGNPDTQESVVEELRLRIPCLAFAPRPRVFSDYLVLDALSAFARGADWQTPLAAALRVRPGVDRLVGGAHPMARFELTVNNATARQPIPTGARVFVDGEPASALPVVGELHLVQITENGLWRSQLFKDAPVPASFLSDPIEAPLTWSWWGHAGAAIGPGGVRQRRSEVWVVEADQAAYIPNQGVLTAWPAIVARGGATYGLLGINAELDVGLVGLTRPIGSHAQIAVVVGKPTLRLGGGAGVGGSTRIQGASGEILPGAAPEYTQSTDSLAYVFATTTHVSNAWDAGLSAGFGPSTLRGGMYVGYAQAEATGAPRLRIGLSSDFQRGTFTLGEAAADGVSTLTWRAGAEVGVRR